MAWGYFSQSQFNEVTRGEMENLVIDFSNSIVNINDWHLLDA
jgi:hypothetical protein